MGVKINLLNPNSGKIRTLDIRNEVPVYSEREDKTRGYVKAGRNNLYFQELVSLIKGSGIARSCSNIKAKFIYGEGFSFETKGKNYEIFWKGQDIPKVFGRLSIDAAYFEGYALHFRHNLQGKITEVHHLDFSNVRLGVPNPETGRIEKAFVSADWSKAGNTQYPWAAPVEMPLHEWEQDKVRKLISKAGKDYKGTVLYVKPYMPSHFYYVPPAWAAADDRIEVDRLTGEFHANNAENGFYPAAFMYMPGDDWDAVVDQESGETKADAFKKWFAEKYKGAKNAGEMMFTFGTSKENSPTPIPFQPNVNGDMFMSLENNTVRYIPIAFQVPPILAGISEAGKLGATQEILNAIELFQNNIIGPVQLQIKEIFTKIQQNFEGWQGDPEIDIWVAKPINSIPDKVWEKLTDDEIRAAGGYAPLETQTPSSQEQTLQAISTLSPLVANKVLSALTPDELRALIGVVPLTDEQKAELAAINNPNPTEDGTIDK